MSIQSATRAIAEAEQRAESAREALADAEAKIKVLRDRSGFLDAERVAIVTSRKAGTIDPAHGARLHEIAVDREGLSELIADADRATRPMRTAAADAEQALAGARRMLAQTENATYLEALVMHASDLARLFDATLVELAATTTAAGELRPRWYPPGALVDRLYKLRLMGDQLGVAR